MAGYLCIKIKHQIVTIQESSSVINIAVHSVCLYLSNSYLFFWKAQHCVIHFLWFTKMLLSVIYVDFKNTRELYSTTWNEKTGTLKLLIQLNPIQNSDEENVKDIVMLR